MSQGTADDDRVEKSHQKVVNADGESGLDERGCHRRKGVLVQSKRVGGGNLEESVESGLVVVAEVFRERFVPSVGLVGDFEWRRYDGREQSSNQQREPVSPNILVRGVEALPKPAVPLRVKSVPGSPVECTREHSPSVLAVECLLS